MSYNVMPVVLYGTCPPVAEELDRLRPEIIDTGKEWDDRCQITVYGDGIAIEIEFYDDLVGIYIESEEEFRAFMAGMTRAAQKFGWNIDSCQCECQKGE